MRVDGDEGLAAEGMPFEHRRFERAWAAEKEVDQQPAALAEDFGFEEIVHPGGETVVYLEAAGVRRRVDYVAEGCEGFAAERLRLNYHGATPTRGCGKSRRPDDSSP